MPPKTPRRPGAFSANFDPEILISFRDLCTSQNRQYTKILQKLAEIYLLTEGKVLDSPDVVEHLTRKVEYLEEELRKAQENGTPAKSASTGDLKDFYPSSEVGDWKEGWAVLNAKIQKLEELIRAGSHQVSSTVGKADDNYLVGNVREGEWMHPLQKDPNACVVFDDDGHPYLDEDDSYIGSRERTPEENLSLLLHHGVEIPDHEAFLKKERERQSQQAEIPVDWKVVNNYKEAVKKLKADPSKCFTLVDGHPVLTKGIDGNFAFFERRNPEETYEILQYLGAGIPDRNEYLKKERNLDHNLQLREDLSYLKQELNNPDCDDPRVLAWRERLRKSNEEFYNPTDPDIIRRRDMFKD